VNDAVAVEDGEFPRPVRGEVHDRIIVRRSFAAEGSGSDIAFEPAESYPFRVVRIVSSGGRDIASRSSPAETVYLAFSGLYAFFTTVVVSVSLVYQTQQVGLNPFQLVLVGAVLEGTRLVFEVPTGVIADTRSRRLSVILGVVLAGCGYALTGAFARFETILAAQFVVGIGLTFISGAQQAWIADEVGAEEAGRVYLSSSQLAQVGRFVGIPVGVLLALISLQVPLVVGGVLLVALGLLLAVVMPEQNYVPSGRPEDGPWANMKHTLTSGVKLVRRTPVLVTILAITVFYNAAGEGFSRLSVAHFLRDLGFPTIGHFQPIVWFGLLRMVTFLLSIVAVQYLRTRIDTNSHASVTRWLMALNALQIGSLVAFAAAGGFYAGAIAYWCANIPSFMFDPLYAAWINQNVNPQVRATVMSMSGQADSLGQIAGGPVMGAVGSLVSIGASLLVAAAALLPVMALYLIALAQGTRQATAAAGAD
jgi:DHA3 family tetracycline resistance protein-like MFS transporter